MVLDLSNPESPAPFDEVDLIALQAVAQGIASADQQKHALKWIVEMAARVYEPSFKFGPDGDRKTIFLEGRRWVGLQIIANLQRLPENYKDRP